MDSFFSLVPSKSLSEMVQFLVHCLSQDTWDNVPWMRIRPRILNDLNTVVSEGEFNGYSALFILASCR